MMQSLRRLLVVTFLLVSLGAAAQNTDSVSLEILRIMNNKLSRIEQLEVLDYLMKSKFDVMYEVNLMMENLTKEEREDLLLQVMRKANIPIKPKEEEHAVVFWKEVEFNFHGIPNTKVVKHVFEFENVGKIPYVIEDVSSSCGCTIADWTKEVVPPGGKGSITVTYDAINKSLGEHTEFITVVGNTFPRRAVLVVYASVYKTK